MSDSGIRNQFRYTVSCHFSEKAVAEGVHHGWVDWMRNGHIQDVIDGGAEAGEVVELDFDDGKAFEVRYFFKDRDTFLNYESNHAPALREEGLAKFPHELGLNYHRTIGEVLVSVEK